MFVFLFFILKFEGLRLYFWFLFILFNKLKYQNFNLSFVGNIEAMEILTF